MIRVLFVCHGNICRSPMAEFVFKDMLEKRGLTDRFLVCSAATSDEEIWRGVGNPIYPPAQDELRRHNIGGTEYTDFSSKRAVQLVREDYDRYDYILCADAMNIRNVLRIVGSDPEGKVQLLLDYAGRPGESIADPWYTGDFSRSYSDIVSGLNGFLGRFCPCCYESMLESEGKYEICEVCGWEDDPVARRDPDFVGGANRNSLREERELWAKKRKRY